MQLRRRSFKGFDKLFSDWMLPWTSSRPASRRTRRQCSKPSADVIKVVTSMQLPDGRNLVEEHGRLFSQLMEMAGVTSFAQRGAGSKPAPAQQVATHPHQLTSHRVATPRSDQEDYDEAAGLRATSQKHPSPSERASLLRAR